MFKKKLLAVALAAVGSMGAAQAGVLGQSVLDITNFRFLNPDGSTVSAAQFDVLIFNDSSLGVANLNGVADSAVANSNTPGTLDMRHVCVGDCAGFGENNYSHRLAPSTVNVARADTLLTGAPILGLGMPTGATARVVNEGQLTTVGGFANIQANLGLTASVSFSTQVATTIGVAFDALIHLIAHVDATNQGTARATSSWTIELLQGNTTLFSWSPNGQAGGITGGVEFADACNINQTQNAQLPGTTNVFDCAGSFGAFTSFVLDPSLTYTLGLRHAGAVDVTRQVVPEPASLALMGLALMGLGAGRLRRSKQA